MSKNTPSSARIRPAALPAWEKLQAALISTAPDYVTTDRPRAGWWPGHNLTPSQKGTHRG